MSAQIAALTRDESRCPSCGHGGSDWDAWSRRQAHPYCKRILFRDTFKDAKGQQAKVAKMLQLAGENGLTKRQLPGWNLGHWVRELRDDGSGLTITTEMVKKTFPKKSVHAVYRLEEPVTIIDQPPKEKPARAKRASQNPKANGIESGVSDE